MTTGDLILGEFEDKPGWEHAEGIFWGIAAGVGLLVFLAAFLVGMPLLKKRCKVHAENAAKANQTEMIEVEKEGITNEAFEDVDHDDAGSVSSEKIKAKK